MLQLLRCAPCSQVIDARLQRLKKAEPPAPLKSKPRKIRTDTAADRHPHRDVSLLKEYHKDPSTARRVIYYNDNFIVIQDAYPKSTVHWLVLPRDKDHVFLDPADALDNAWFRTMCQSEVETVKKLVAAELRFLHGKTSALDQARKAAMNNPEHGDAPLPPGRDWLKDVIAGCHTNPSMSHLHIHVLSRDMYSKDNLYGSHYGSFNSLFFIPLSEFPIDTASERYIHGKTTWHYDHLICWYCKKNFGREGSETARGLKGHIKEHYKVWRRH